MIRDLSVRLPLGLAGLLLCVLMGAFAQGAQGVAQALPFALLPSVHITGDGAMTPDASGTFQWLGQDGRKWSSTDYHCVAAPTTLDSWNPVTGQLTQRPIVMDGLTENALLQWQAQLPTGIVGLWIDSCPGRQMALFGFVANDGKTLGHVIEYRESQPPSPKVVLSPSTLGYVWRTEADRHLHVETISVVDGALLVTQMPELAVAYRNDYGLSAVGPGNLMILGGGDDPYRGCNACRDQTYVLDVKTGQWSDGPRMLEARSELNATALADGGVLVSGGFTRLAGWSKGSRTVERLDPATGRFVPAAPMPSGNAGHRAMVLPGSDGRLLMMIAGTSGNILGYEPERDTWQVLASGMSSQYGGCAVFPFQAAGRLYAWAESGSFEHSQCLGDQSLYPVALRQTLFPRQEAVAVPPQLLSLHRQGAVFLPATASEPAMVMGGSGLNVVDSIDTSDRLGTVSPMQAAHDRGRAFRFNGGVLIMDGSLDNFRKSDPPQQYLMEWLPSGKADDAPQWQRVDGTAPSVISAVTTLANGNLLEVNAAGEIHEISLDSSTTPASLKRVAWPAFKHLRRPSATDPMQIRQIGDGRIVFVGGESQPRGLALFSPDSERPDALDEFQYLGDFDSVATYVTFDPQRGQWSESAASVFTQATSLILADGRVVRFGIVPLAANDGPYPMEISSFDGTRWLRQPDTGLPSLGKYRKVLAVSDDLVMKGWVVEDSAPNGGHYDTDWFDPQTLKWTIVLSAGSQGLEYQVVRLPNNHSFVLQEDR